MPFSENLRFLRESKGLTQREVAEAVDINLRTLQNYELGKCFPRKEAVAEKLAGFYNIPLTVCAFLWCKSPSVNRGF